MICNHTSKFGSKQSIIEVNDLPNYEEYVIFKPDPYITVNKFVAFCSKIHQLKCKFYDVSNFKNNYQAKSGELPHFVHELNGTLFEKIEGVVDYKYGEGHKGWLFLFNIDGRVKYCFTTKYLLSTEVSVCPLITKPNYYFQCKSEQNMKSLFNECFQERPPIPDLITNLTTVLTTVLTTDLTSDLTTDLPTDATPTDSESFLKKHLIVITISVTVIIVVILIVVTTALIYRCRQKNVSTLTSSSQFSTSFGKPSGKSIEQSIENAKQKKKDKQKN